MINKKKLFTEAIGIIFIVILTIFGIIQTYNNRIIKHDSTLNVKNYNNFLNYKAEARPTKFFHADYMEIFINIKPKKYYKLTNLSLEYTVSFKNISIDKYYDKFLSIDSNRYTTMDKGIYKLQLKDFSFKSMELNITINNISGNSTYIG